MEQDVDAWFAEYLGGFAACGRGERPPADALAWYGVPLLITTDDVVVALSSPDEVTGWVTAQVEGMLEAGYARSEVLAGETSAINRTTALHRGEFSRRRADGTEIARLAVTYVITGSAGDRRISALLVH